MSDNIDVSRPVIEAMIYRRGLDHGDGADEELVRALLDRAEKAEADNAAKQARIDALMLEYCPDEMTPEQLDEWGRNQVATHDREQAERGKD